MDFGKANKINSENKSGIQQDPKKKVTLKKKGSSNHNKQNTFSRNAKLKREKYNFRYRSQLLIILGILAMFLINKAVLFMILSIRAKRITGLTKTCILGMESYASFFQLHNAAFQVLLWNNTSPIWGSPALDMYEHFKNTTKEKLIKNLTEALSYDLGNYTIFFNDTLLNTKACGTVFLSLEPHLCSESYGGVVNSNLRTSLLGMIDVLDDFVQNWKVINKDWRDTKAMLETRTFRSIWAKADSIIFDLYYYIVLKITDTIVAETESNYKLMSTFEKYISYLFLVWIMIVIMTLWNSVWARTRIMNRTLAVTPLRLWKSNMKLFRK